MFAQISLGRVFKTLRNINFFPLLITLPSSCSLASQSGLIKCFQDEMSTVVLYSGIKLNCVKFECKMLLDFAAKNDKAKCKIKHQMESVLIIRGYKVLVEMIENIPRNIESVSIVVSALTCWLLSVTDSWHFHRRDSTSWNKRFNFHYLECVCLTGFFQIVYLHKCVKF